MSNPVSFMNSLIANTQSLIQQIELAQQLNDMVVQDSTLITRYFSTTPYGANPNTIPRTDIVAQDVTNALSALTQLAFTFNSGSPTQKSYLYKLTP